MPGTDLKGESYGQGMYNTIAPFKGKRAWRQRPFAMQLADKQQIQETIHSAK